MTYMFILKCALKLVLKNIRGKNVWNCPSIHLYAFVTCTGTNLSLLNPSLNCLLRFSLEIGVRQI